MPELSDFDLYLTPTKRWRLAENLTLCLRIPLEVNTLNDLLCLENDKGRISVHKSIQELLTGEITKHYQFLPFLLL